MATANMRTPDKDEFLKDVALHEMTVKLDQGIHRHLTFRDPKTFNRHFHITTWPGYLAVSGDMGSFVFARLADMFEFFRGADINPQYWAEKVQAEDRNGGYERFSEELYRDAVTRDFAEWSFGSDSERARAWTEIQVELLNSIPPDADGYVAVGGAMDYICPVSRRRFVDFWDHTFNEYTYHFIWACYAIRWAIERYDASAAAKVAA